jgi:ubiquinone/menaquinone biosynthesis C-methylase UbiE
LYNQAFELVPQRLPEIRKKSGRPTDADGIGTYNTRKIRALMPTKDHGDMEGEMNSNRSDPQLDANRRLIRGLVELRAHQVDSSAISAFRYDELHAEEQLNQRDSFYKWLLSLLRPRPGQRLLDVSCGRGKLLRFATEADLDVAGLDLSVAAVMSAVEQVPCAHTSIANAERLPYADNTFDHITNIGSLEHYFQPHYAAREMARTLRPGGLALVLLPNTFGLLGNILHVWRKGDVFDDGQPLQRYGTNVQWRSLLEMNGLRVIRTVKFEREWPGTWRDFWWYLRHPHKLGRVLVTWLIPVNLASFLVYLCEKDYP